MASSRAVSKHTLFHLVPRNDMAKEALAHPKNCGFVSLSAINENGLEIGYHVPPIPRGHVITKLGRKTDITLQKSGAQIHVAFEINPTTELIMLSLRSKYASTVTVSLELDAKDLDTAISEEINGDCVVIYGQNYLIKICEYLFLLVWRRLDPETKTPHAEWLKALALQCYSDSIVKLNGIPSPDRSDEVPPSEERSWYETRLQSVKKPVFQEFKKLRRVIGSGSYGQVWSNVDVTSSYEFAVKEVDLTKQGGVGNTETARAMLLREIKIMEQVKHQNIIPLLGTDAWDTPKPVIFMPLCKGTARQLFLATDKIRDPDAARDRLFHQMLSALDYLAYCNFCHRDVKPDNILYTIDASTKQYHFQLADFGLANHQRLATTMCGTPYYQAPEAIPGSRYQQSPKMDVWSLMATMLDLLPNVPSFPPIGAKNFDDVVRAVQEAVRRIKPLQPLARVEPDQRASAAQILVGLFRGEGLTTPINQVPPISPETTATGTANKTPQSGPPVAGAARVIQIPRPDRPRIRQAPGAGAIAAPSRDRRQQGQGQGRGREQGRQQEQALDLVAAGGVANAQTPAKIPEDKKDKGKGKEKAQDTGDTTQARVTYPVLMDLDP